MLKVKTIEAPVKVRFHHPVLLTAMVYLRDALVAERYEECAGLIEIAKEFGANTWDLHSILTDFQNTHFPGEKKKKAEI